METRLGKILAHLAPVPANDVCDGMQLQSNLTTVDNNEKQITRSYEKIAFKMYLSPGQVAEYKRRHDLIPSQWPELKRALTDSGVMDYSIFFDEEHNVLFACLWRTKDNKMDALPQQEIVQKWWKYMSEMMKTCDDSVEPVTVDLPCVFHMD
eukprot:508220_1